MKPDGHATVLDFGIARRPVVAVDPHGPTAARDDLATLTARGAIVGTPLYMAPEQLHGAALDGRTDEFAWGVVAYELFAGKPPWSAGDVVALIASILGNEPQPLAIVAPEVPSGVARVVDRALAKSPDARFASMRELLDALARARRIVETVALEQPAARPGRSLAWGGLAAVLAVGAVALGVASRSHAKADVTAAPAASSVAPVASASAIPITRPAAARVRRAARGRRVQGRAAGVPRRTGRRRAALRGGAQARSIDGPRVLAWRARDRRDVADEGADARGVGPARELARARGAAARGDGAVRAQAAPSRRRWCVDRLRALADAHPRDAEYRYRLAVQENLAGHMARSREEGERALSLDPRFGAARYYLVQDDAYLGDFERLDRDVDACTANGTGSLCLDMRKCVEQTRGDGERLDKTAARLLGLAPDDPNGHAALALADACLGRPRAAIQHAAKRMVALTPAVDRDRVALETDAELALYDGDFTGALGLFDRIDERLASVRGVGAHANIAAQRVATLVEIGKVDDAASAARAYLDLKPSLEELWSASTTTRSSRIASATCSGRCAGRGACLERTRGASATRSSPRGRTSSDPTIGPTSGSRPTLLRCSTPRTRARRSMRSQPSAGYRSSSACRGRGLIGRVHHLAGNRELALKWLEDGARSCWLPFRVEPIASSLWLGEVREEAGDKAGACAAYAFVVARWEHATPKSLSADEAKRRRAALGCKG